MEQKQSVEMASESSRQALNPSEPRVARAATFIAKPVTTKGYLQHGSRPAYAENVPLVSRVADFYHWFVSLGWLWLCILMAALYIIATLVFAGLLWAERDGTVLNATTFGDYLVFAIQTWSTLGYGYLLPGTPWAHVMVTFINFVFIIFSSLIGSVLVIRFSKPVPQIKFSDVLCVATFNGRRCIMFRLANARSRNTIINAMLTLNMVRDEITGEGVVFRKHYPMRLMFDLQPLFSAMWLAVHYIDEPSSPLHQITEGSAETWFRSIVVTLTGYDTDMGQTMLTAHSYYPQHLRWDQFFDDMLSERPDGGITVDHSKLNSLHVLDHPSRQKRVSVSEVGGYDGQHH